MSKKNIGLTQEAKTETARVIIGSGFGDEGKGLLTDWSAAPAGGDCITTRFNGGAQAGHTVVLPDGRRHVHSHFGSGTLAGGATFLSKHFVSNPLLFGRERRALAKLKIPPPVVYADERGFVSTPFDMLLNQFAERTRGQHKHGSCGIGFGETIERCLDERFATTIGDLADIRKLAAKLDDIRRSWVPVRLEKLGIEVITAEQHELLESAALRSDFIDAANSFYADVKLARPDILTTGKRIILEGAQGLLLDQDGGWFPHVTRSNTGLRNAVQLAGEAGIGELEVIYATRSYATRHGAGPFPNELPDRPYRKITDPTNIPNAFQDALRFGHLDLDLLKKTIDADFQKYSGNSGIRFRRALAVTCLDQIDEKAFFVSDGRLIQSDPGEFATALMEATGFDKGYLSYGPTRETISEFRSGSRTARPPVRSEQSKAFIN
jgi:adenylosuccinate synthase